MSEYQLEIKQLVDYPRCRVYRQFIRTLIEDRNLHSRGGSCLFYFIALCSYANFRTSYRRIDGISYTVYPGEWICTPAELRDWFRCRFQHQALSILDGLQEKHYITYTKLNRDRLIKFKITDWQKSNRILEYNARCQKDTGFFFFPVSAIAELVSVGKCSELDIVLDLWLNTIYKDEQVQGSDIGPVVYFRNCTGDPTTNYSELSQRWGVSRSTVGRVLTHLSELDYLSMFTFPGSHGSVIYLKNYLSTMFQISDVIIDKEEVTMSLNMNVTVSDEADADECAITDDQISVPEDGISVSKPHIKAILQKAANLLAIQGIDCCLCRKAKYKLYSYPGDCEGIDSGGSESYMLEIGCTDSDSRFRFELTLKPIEKN